MIIHSLHIYGFGKHTDVEMHFNKQKLLLFYGENEAGKSTIMAFIRAIFFGFPSRVQGKRVYEPKSGGKYGGNVVIEVEKEKKITIERIAGNAKGKVNVLFPDGRIGHEEELKTLLNGMEGSLFDSVYAFDIHGLQGLEKMSIDELGEFLFSAGVTGKQGLYRLENKLDQKLNSLFKPGGKKPLLNQKMLKLEEERAMIYDWQEKIEEYQELESKLTSLEEYRKQIEEEKISNDKQLKCLQLKLRIEPYVEEELFIEYQLKQLPQYDPFPQDGLERLDKLQAQMDPLKSQLQSLEKRERAFEQELADLKIEDKLFEVENTLQKCLETKKVYEMERKELDELLITVKEAKEGFAQSFEQLGPEISLEKISEIDLSLQAKEELKELVRKEQELAQQKQWLDEEFQHNKQSLNQHEARINYYKQHRLAESDRTTLENKLKFASQAGTRNQQKEQYEQSLHQLDEKIKQLKKPPITQSVQFVLVLLFLICSFYSWFFTEASRLLPFLFLVLTLIVFLFHSLKKLFVRTYLRDLIKERKVIQKHLAEINDEPYVNEDEYVLQKKFLENEQIEQQLKHEEFQYMQTEKVFNHVVERFENWEKEWLQVREAISEFCEKKYLPKPLSSDRLIDAFELLLNIKNEARKLDQKEHRINRLEKQVESFQEDVYKLADIFRIDMSEQPILFVLDNVQEIYEKEIEKVRFKKQIQQKHQEVIREMNDIKAQIEHFQKEIGELFYYAQVQHEEEFRFKGKAALEAEKRNEQLKRIEAQLSSMLKKDHFSLIAEVKAENRNYQEAVKTLEDRNRAIETEIQEIRAKQAEASYKLENLRDGQDYSELLHQFEIQKSEFDLQAKHWVKYQLARELISTTKEYYYHVRLPKVIEEATSYFTFLTEGQYHKIFALQDKQHFIVERYDGVRFTPGELSQATTEQLYLAIRFALASVYQSKLRYPMIIDDSFVNFDHNRLRKTIQLLKQISHQHQVLFFTCHQHLLDYFEQDQVISL